MLWVCGCSAQLEKRKRIILVIKTLWKNIRWNFERILPYPKLKRGTISFDFWNIVDEDTKKEIEAKKESYIEKNIPPEKIEKYVSLFVEDTRRKKRPFIKIYFNQEIARTIYEEDEQKDYFGWYEIQNLKTKTLKIKEGKVVKYENSMNFRVNPDWNVKYEIKKFPEDKKEIAGYICIKYEITELKEIKGNTTKREFSIYSTNKIKLPGHLICNWYDKVIKECPLEITINHENKKGGVFYKVREISKEIPKSVLKIPKRFEK